jgi:hypothetical protein
MLPCFACDDRTYIRLSDIKLFGYDRLRDAVSIHAPNFNAINFSYLCAHIAFACQCYLSTLCYHIGIVISTCTDKEVGRIATRRVIAFMANDHAFRNETNMNLVRESVRHMMGLPIVKDTVSFCRSVAAPFPAGIWFANRQASPKLHLNCARNNTMPLEIARGFTFAYAAALTCKCINACLLPATAVAVAVRDFIKGKLGLDKLWGMLRHVDFLLLGIGQSRGRLQRRSATCIGFYSCNYTT